MPLHLETGHPVTADVQQLDAKAVRFVTEDGRCMFEVSAGKDGRSLEVRAVEVTKVDGKVYSNRLLVWPDSTNGVTVGVPLYDEA